MKSLRNIGPTTDNLIGPINMPPTTTVVSGRCTCEPMACERIDLKGTTTNAPFVERAALED